MKVLMALLGLITASLHSGAGAITVKIGAYTAIGEMTKMSDTVPQGTRVLFTCDVKGLPEGQVVNRYKWYYSFASTGRYEIQEDEPYYTAVNDTLLVDTTYWGGMLRQHICEVGAENDFYRLKLSDSSTPFILTPTSLLPKHALITDVQQITGRNGQQWINCTSGRNGGNVQILSVVDRSFSVGNRMNTAIIGPQRYPRNGLYYCSAEPRSFYYISLFLRKSSNLPTLIISVRDNTTWTFTPRNGSQVKRYIVEFECRVRNMTFVEKYMSDSASGGTGRVATSESCFGGLGQLYRVKVWAVSGPNISRWPAVKVINTVERPTLTTQVTSTPTIAGDQGGFGTFIGVGVGIGMLLLIVVLVLVGVIVAVVMVKKRAAKKKAGSMKMRHNPIYSNPVMVELEVEGLGADYEDADKDKANGSVVDGFHPYEDVHSKGQMKNTKTPTPKESSTPASATKVGELYAVVDKSKKKGTKEKQEDDGCTDTNKDDLYTVPIKQSKMKNVDKGIVATDSAGKSEDCDDVAELNCEPKEDSEPGQQCQGDSKFPNADILYAVVDKSCKKKK